MKKVHNIRKVAFSGNRLILTVDEIEHSIDIAKHSQKLSQASASERRHYIISPSGYGIHWPELDEDLSVDGLIGVKHSPLFITSRA